MKDFFLVSFLVNIHKKKNMVASTSLDVVPDDPTAYKTQQYWEDRYQKYFFSQFCSNLLC
jgi:hypothetical protein